MNTQKLRGTISDSFWFVPAACALGAVALASALLELDELLPSPQPLAFTGSPSAARDLLSTVASGTLTLAGLVFSITIVVLQLTSTQFSPRVLRTFLKDLRTKLSLGVFLATYVYALVALRKVRGENGVDDLFVPGITITVAFILVLGSVAMFVLYIHHISQSIRVVTIISRIADEARNVLDQRFPDDGAGDSTHAPRDTAARAPTRVLPANSPGVLTAIDAEPLVALAAEADVTLRVLPQVGDFVPTGAALVEVRGAGEVDSNRVYRELTLRRERTMDEDVGFGLRQLVDIAERALSPGINDPTTAVQTLDQIHDLLRRLATRPFPSGSHCDDDGVVRLTVPVASWSDYVGLGLDEIRHWGANSARIHQRLRVLILDLLDLVGDDRRAPLLQQLRLLDERAALDLPAPERDR